MTVPGTEHLVSPGEAALILRCSTKTVVRWADLGAFPTAAVTDGGHRRFYRADIERIRDERAARAGAA